jgi:hypothetical protein
VRRFIPSTLRLFAKAYVLLLRAYPASFRTEFGGEMALVFSACCRDAWRRGGSARVLGLLGRTVLDVLASAPLLWAERLEEVMNGNRNGRGMGLWLVDHGLAASGLALLALGATVWPLAVPLGWTALWLAFFAWVAEADGFPVPRPGRVAIQLIMPGGGFDIPLAFKVRRGERVLFFVCEEDPERGVWSDVYTVLDQPKGPDGLELCYGLPPATRSGWSLRGRTPVAALRFEHHERATYVTRESLERSLASAGV